MRIGGCEFGSQGQRAAYGVYLMSYHPPEPVGSEPDLLDIDGERCARILQLLNEAWERASECQEVNPASGEVEITESLRDCLRDVIVR